MKNILHVTIAIAIMLFSSNALTKGPSTILLSEQSGKFALDFLNEDRVTALQFDIIIDGVSNKQMKAVSLDSCISGLPKTHIGVCKLNNNRLRVLVYSQSNAILESGSIGSFILSKGVKKSGVKINSIVMGTPELKEIKGEAILDLSFRQDIERRDFNK